PPVALLAIAEPPDDRETPAHARARTHEHFDLRRQHEVGPRAELYQAEALAPLQAFAGPLPADDPPRQNPRDLLTDDLQALPADGQGVLLVDDARFVARRALEAPARVGHVADDAGYRRAVDVHVEGREEDADDARRERVSGRELPDARHATVRRRDDESSPLWDFPLRVAEEVGHESRQEQEHCCQPPDAQKSGRQRRDERREYPRITLSRHLPLSKRARAAPRAGRALGFSKPNGNGGAQRI